MADYFAGYRVAGKQALATFLTLAVFLGGCSGTVPTASAPEPSAAQLHVFGPGLRVGRADAGPASPFLRSGPDGKLVMAWTEKEPGAPAGDAGGTSSGENANNHSHGSTAAAGTRAAFMAISADGGQTWSTPQRVNDRSENVQGDENLPKVAFGNQGKLYTAWSIPGAKGDKMRANIRFAHTDASGQFLPAVTLNEIPDVARFPALELSPDGTVYVAWIDRRVDAPAPRAIYLSRMDAAGKVMHTSTQIGGPSCECCRVVMAFADGGKRVHVAYRGKTDASIRDIVVQTSTDGGNTFGDPVVVSNDGWHIESCPHAGPVMATDAQGNLHITWFTQGSKPDEAGIYYTVSRDGGRTFAPRQLIQAANGPGALRSYLAVGAQGDVYLAWDNFLPGQDQTQIFFRHLAADGKTLSPVQQISQFDGNALRPSVSVSGDHVQVAWTEARGDDSWVVIKTAPIFR